jgi:Xaa-Pro aminopeptidase
MQLKAYQTTLEAQKAIIAAIRPGVTRQVVRSLAEDIFRKQGFDPRYAYIGHYVGLSVHDVGDWALPFEAGMVMAIEPIVDIPEQQLHIRVEDTILVTPTGACSLAPDGSATNSRHTHRRSCPRRTPRPRTPRATETA